MLKAASHFSKTACPVPLAWRPATAASSWRPLWVGVDLTGTSALVEEVRWRVEELGVEYGVSPISSVLTVSLGVSAGWPRPGSRSQELISAADRALYQAKVQGRNQIVAQALDLDPEPDNTISDDQTSNLIVT
ncbi:hypothetical protein DFAR_2080002 [Desulfarculales bacterium]